MFLQRSIPPPTLLNRIMGGVIFSSVCTVLYLQLDTSEHHQDLVLEYRPTPNHPAVLRGFSPDTNEVVALFTKPGDTVPSQYHFVCRPNLCRVKAAHVFWTSQQVIEIRYAPFYTPEGRRLCEPPHLNERACRWVARRLFIPASWFETRASPQFIAVSEAGGCLLQLP